MKNVLLFDAIFQVQGSQEYSFQLTDDKSDDESEQLSSKRACAFDQECSDDIYSILFGDDQIATSASGSSFRGKNSKIQQEMNIYLSDPLVPKKSNLLAWWKLNENRLPLLSQLAEKNLGTITASVRSERLFPQLEIS